MLLLAKSDKIYVLVRLFCCFGDLLGKQTVKIMNTLEKIIRGKIIKIVVMLSIAVFFVVSSILFLHAHKTARETAKPAFEQIRNAIDEEHSDVAYIFPMLKVTEGVSYYAIDKETGQVVGATEPSALGKNLEEIGFKSNKIKKEYSGFHGTINGKRSYCVFMETENLYVGRIMINDTVYSRVLPTLFGMLLTVLVFSLFVIRCVNKSVKKYIINDIHSINENLRDITSGKMDERVRVDSSVEFSELSSHINEMVQCLVADNKKLEIEKNMDLLTGIYNRSGFWEELSKLLKNPEGLDYGAVVVLDADGLKNINDEYGHGCGDIYLKKIAGAISNFGVSGCLGARFGGDEFVMFLYDYDTQETLDNAIASLEYVQKHSTVRLRDDLVVPLKFSFGYEYSKDRSDFDIMLKQADEKMYANKKQRKATRRAE